MWSLEYLMFNFSAVDVREATSIVPYNQVLSMMHLIENSDMCFLSDLSLGLNEYMNHCRYISQPYRLPNYSQSSMRTMCANLVPYPRLHFATSSLVFGEKMQETSCFERLLSDCSLCSFPTFDVFEKRFITSLVISRNPFDVSWNETYSYKTNVGGKGSPISPDGIQAMHIPLQDKLGIVFCLLLLFKSISRISHIDP